MRECWPLPAKTRTEVLPQLVQPIERWLSKFPFHQKAAVVGLGGAIAAAPIALYVPSLVALLGVFIGFFAALASMAFFKAYETESDLLNHRRRILGPVEYRAKALVDDPDPNLLEFEKRLEDFKRLEDSPEFGFLSDNLRGTYLDCVHLAERYGRALKGELRVEVVRNEFGITADSIDVKEVTRAPLSRLVILLVDQCRLEAKVPQPHRTLRVGTFETKKIGKLILYRKTEERSSP